MSQMAQILASTEDDSAINRGAVARRLIGELAPQRRRLLLAGFWTLLAAAAQAAGPATIGVAIDGPITDGDPDGLLLLMGLLLLIYVTGALASREQVGHVGAIGQRVLADFRARLFNHLQRLPLRFFDRRPLGDLVSRVSSDTETLNQFMSQGLAQSVGSVFGLIGVMIAMIVLDWKLALASFAIIPVMLATTALFARRARAAFRTARRTTGAVTAELQEEISGIREAQAFNRTGANIERFQRRNRANRDANVTAVGVTSSFAPAIDMLSTLAAALVLGYGGWRVYQGDLSVGLLAAFLLYVQQFFRPIQMLAQTYTLAQSALAGAERIYGILDEHQEPADPPDAISPATVDGEITFDGVTFGYETNRPVLHDLSFTILPGQTVALVGPTGAGKTTIVNLIPRFYDLPPGSGTMYLDGTNTQRIRRDALRQHVAMVLQEPFLFTGTVAENIAYGRPDATRDDVIAAATAAAADSFIQELTDGYETVLGAGGSGLSEGQRQLLAFARAILADPRVLILDEATSRVDTRTERLIQDALRTLLAGRTSIVIAHRLSTVRDADLILVIDRGRIVERGTHAELLEHDGLYARLYQRQFRDSPPPPAEVAAD